MPLKKSVVGFASCLLVAILVTGCKDSVPTEPQADATRSLTATPEKATSIAAVVDLSGPIPGFPNVTNRAECMTLDTETLIAHFKNCIVVGTIRGDLNGDITGIMNGWQHAVLLNGRVFGFGSLSVCHDDFGCGVFEGPHKGTIPAGGQATLRLNAHGTGVFHTMQIRFTMVEQGNTEIFDLEGVIF